MKKLPPIDITEIVNLLRKEGTSEITVSCAGNLGGFSQFLREWSNIVHVLCVEIAPKLKRGAAIEELTGPITLLARSSAALASMASQILSFVPGPVGIVCSLINAIVCFCTLPFPINIGNGMLELLGCIPGGKVAAKGGAKLAPKIQKLLMKTVEDSPELARILKETEKIHKIVKDFTEKAVKSKPVKTNSPVNTLQGSHIYTDGANNLNFNHLINEVRNKGKANAGHIMAEGQITTKKELDYITQTKSHLNGIPTPVFNKGNIASFGL